MTAIPNKSKPNEPLGCGSLLPLGQVTQSCEPYIGLAEVSCRLALSTRTIRAHISASTTPLPAYRIGGKLKFRWCEVEAWIQRHRVQVQDVGRVADEIIRELERSQNG